MKRVFFFGNGRAEGAGLGKERLGGKGSGLAEMTALGIPVPPGFTIEAAVSAEYSRGANLDELKKEVAEALAKLETAAGRRFGDAANPLLVSVRSGARSSMPGMMDTILNLGLEPRDGRGPRARPRDARFALDCCRPLHPDVRRRRARRTGEGRVRARADREAPERRAPRRTRSSRPPISADLVAPFRGDHRASTRARRSPRTRSEQLWGAIARGVPLAGTTSARRTYRQPARHPRRLGHRGQRAGHGVRQPRRRLRHRRRLHARSRRPARSGSTASSCPTRRARTSWPASARRGHLNADGSRRPRSKRRCRRPTRSCCASRRCSRSTTATCRTSSSRSRTGSSIMLQTRNGKRTGLRGGAHRGRHGGRGADHARTRRSLRVEPEQLDPAPRARLRPLKEKAAAVDGGRLLGKGLPAGPGAACGRIALHGGRGSRDGGQGRRRSFSSAPRRLPKTSPA